VWCKEGALGDTWLGCSSFFTNNVVLLLRCGSWRLSNRFNVYEIRFAKVVCVWPQAVGRYKFAYDLGEISLLLHATLVRSRYVERVTTTEMVTTVVA
jgi:hypothetical protein